MRMSEGQNQRGEVGEKGEVDVNGAEPVKKVEARGKYEKRKVVHG